MGLSVLEKLDIVDFLWHGMKTEWLISYYFSNIYSCSLCLSKLIHKYGLYIVCNTIRLVPYVSQEWTIDMVKQLTIEF